MFTQFLFTCSHQCSPKFPGMFNKLFPLLFQVFESCVFHVICKEFFHLIIFHSSLYIIIHICNIFLYLIIFSKSFLCLLICSQCKIFPYKCFRTLGTYCTYEHILHILLVKILLNKPKWGHQNLNIQWVLGTSKVLAKINK